VSDEDDKRVVVSPSGKRFFAAPEISLLESGLASGIALPYSCANGSCGDCRAKVLSGRIRKIRFHDFALSEAEKIAGVCLLCANTADTDLTIEATEATSASDIPLQSLRGKVCHVEYLADVAIVRVKLVRGKALRYLAGQYATIKTSSGATVTLPVANCPCEPDYLEFHVPHQRRHIQNESGNDSGNADSGNADSDKTKECNEGQENLVERLSLSELNLRQRLTIEGPYGNFNLDEQFAAIKPLLEHVMAQDCDTPCMLIWIASDSISHYRHNLCRSWSDAFDNVSYKPLKSINEFTISSVKHWGLQQTGVKIYISGDTKLNHIVSTVLESAGVESELLHIDSTIRSAKKSGYSD